MIRLVAFRFRRSPSRRYSSPRRYAGVIPPDPTIGIRGGDDGSPSVTDGTAFELTPCLDGALPGYFCQPYEYLA